MIKNIVRNIVGGAVALLLLSTVASVARADNAPIPDVMNSGALCDGVHDDTVAIQKAINIPGRKFVIIPAGKTCIVSPQTNPAVPGFGQNSVALYPVSNQVWHIDGTLKLKAGSSGQSGAMIGNWQGTILSNVSFIGTGTLDGNFANAPSANISGIELVDCQHCLMDGFNIVNTGFLGAQYTTSVQPPTTQQPTDVKMTNLHVTNPAFICLQLGFPAVFEVSGNVLTGCGDNGVDIYGNPATTGGSGLTFLGKVHDNLINDTVGVGVFLESVANVDVQGNWIGMRTINPHAAIFLNRITTDARNSIIFGNHMLIGPGVAGTEGIGMQNSSGTANISVNYFDGFESAIHCIAGGCRDIYAHGNFYANIGKRKLAVDQGTGNLFTSLSQQEFNISSRSATTGYPFTASPLTNPSNSPGRSIAGTVLPDFFATNGSVAASAEAEYHDGHSGTLATSCAGFSGVAFFAGAPFGTLVCDTSGQLVSLVGHPIYINGVEYIVSGQSAPNEFSVGQGCTPNTGTQDFSAAINAGTPFTWITYFPAWCTD